MANANGLAPLPLGSTAGALGTRMARFCRATVGVSTVPLIDSQCRRVTEEGPLAPACLCSNRKGVRDGEERAGARREEKASACSVRNDSRVGQEERKRNILRILPSRGVRTTRDNERLIVCNVYRDCLGWGKPGRPEQRLPNSAGRSRTCPLLNVLSQRLKILTATKLDIMLPKRAADVPTGARDTLETRPSEN